MFYFLQPGWMFAAAGIIFPVIIHLWNVQQGKILKIGSVALLTEDTVRNKSSIKLHDLLLLLLRCLLIIFLALLLAQPQWRFQNNGQKGWVLIDKNSLQQTYTHFKPQVDSLIKAGYEFHYFDNGFEKKDIQEALAEKGDSNAHSNVSYWGLLKQLDDKLDTSLPVYLFTDNTLNKFMGNRPAVSLNLHWYTHTMPDTASYIATAYSIPGDSARIIKANSSQAGTLNTYTDIAVTQLKNTEYTLNTGNKGLLLSYKNEPAIAVDTNTLNITIYADKYITDAGYVKAVIDAIQQFSKRKIKVIVESNAANINTKQDWLFWLSGEPIPVNISATNILKYETGKEENIQSWIITGQEYTMNGGQVSLYKYIVATADSGFKETIWQDGFGHALLNKEFGSTNTFHFYSRFDPAWNDLPWSNDFPQMLFTLLLSEHNTATVANTNDRRVIDDKQLQPYFIKQTGAVKKSAATSSDISLYFWFAAFIIFFAERFISSRIKKERRYA